MLSKPFPHPFESSMDKSNPKKTPICGPFRLGPYGARTALQIATFWPGMVTGGSPFELIRARLTCSSDPLSSDSDANISDENSRGIHFVDGGGSSHLHRRVEGDLRCREVGAADERERVRGAPESRSIPLSSDSIESGPW